MSASPKNTKLQVLLVEDSIEDVYLIRSFLEKPGLFQVTTSQDGDHAARLIEERAFDLIITDLNLPGKDGYDLIRLAKAAHPDVPVIATTGYTAPPYLEHAYRAGADHVMVKPLDPEEFLRRVMTMAGAEAETPPPPSVVLAIGALPGDAEGGCGGTLLKYRERGDGLLLLPLSASTADGDSGADAERRAAELMGARVIITEASVSEAGDPAEHQMLLERIVRELQPHTILIPSQADDNPQRREAHRISLVATADVRTVLAYETSTSTPDFRPTRFLDIAPFVIRKLEVLTAFREHDRPDLQAKYVQAAALHWGRYLGYGEAEAFEVLRDDGKDPA